MLIERIFRMGFMCGLFLAITLITNYEVFFWTGFIQGMLGFVLFGVYIVWYKQRIQN